MNFPTGVLCGSSCVDHTGGEGNDQEPFVFQQLGIFCHDHITCRTSSSIRCHTTDVEAQDEFGVTSN